MNKYTGHFALDYMLNSIINGGYPPERKPDGTTMPNHRQER